MPIEFYNLGFNLYQAENAQAVQNLFHMQARGGNEIAAAQTQDTAQEHKETVETATDITNTGIEGEGRGAHSYQLKKEEEEQPEKEKPDEKKPTDPTGRGQVVDLQF